MSGCENLSLNGFMQTYGSHISRYTYSVLHNRSAGQVDNMHFIESFGVMIAAVDGGKVVFSGKNGRLIFCGVISVRVYPYRNSGTVPFDLVCADSSGKPKRVYRIIVRR